MFSRDDTIAAIATPPGPGGLGVIRISGPAACAIAAHLLPRGFEFRPRLATLTHIVDPATGRRIDQAVVTYFKAPASFTGEQVVELSAHGSPVVLREILRAAMSGGARLAEPGEFTLRAYLNGRIDLVQAEAIADLIDAVTPLQARAAFDQLDGTLTTAIGEIDGGLFDLVARLEASIDFPDADYRFVDPSQAHRELAEIDTRIAALLCAAKSGRLVRDGLTIAIAGRPNVGKSSLFNHLVGASRAIVAATPGTTRDLVTERVDVEGLSVTLVDTAGLHPSADEVESEGIERARGAHRVADLVIVVLDRSRDLGDDDFEVITATASRPSVLVVNKIDLESAWSLDRVQDGRAVVPISLRTGDGVGALGPAIVAAAGANLILRDVPAVTNVRHVALLEQARVSIGRAINGLVESDNRLPEEFVLADLQDARSALEEMTGRRTPDDLLKHVFERFCIGK